MDLQTIQAQGEQLLAVLDEINCTRQSWLVKRVEVSAVLHKIASLPAFKKLKLLIRDDTGYEDKRIVAYLENMLTNSASKAAQITNGPTLTLSQIFNGTISVRVNYPLFNGQQLIEEHKLLGVYHPNELNTELLHKVFSEFIFKIIEWNQTRVLE